MKFTDLTPQQLQIISPELKEMFEGCFRNWKCNGKSGYCHKEILCPLCILKIQTYQLVAKKWLEMVEKEINDLEQWNKNNWEIGETPMNDKYYELQALSEKLKLEIGVEI